ncbi:MAG TPA: alpha/beta hydrolase [Pseudomonas sp.]|nr:alpha/beta hydrolase [Pseudomonas sp.]
MRASVTLFVLALCASLGVAAESWQPATLVQAEMRDLQSRHTGRSYRLYLSKPQGEAPPQGYPVVYVLDAELFFPLLAQQALMYTPHAARDGREAVLVVGIGYPGDAPFDIPARAEDYTPPAPNLGDSHTREGGAERFLDFIEDEVKPLVASRYKVDTRRQTLFGHSYGGLFTLYSLLSRPQAFQRYVAASPSLWWHRRYAFDLLETFASHEPRPNVRLMLSVGAAEQPATDAPLLDARQKHLAERRMVDNTREFQQRLGVLGVNAQLQLTPGEDHAGNAFVSSLQVLDFALQR